MNDAPFHEFAHDLLVKQVILTEQMLALLKQEYKALCANFVEPLNTINSDKQPLIVDLNSVNQQWSALLKKVSVVLSPKGIAAYLEDYDQINKTKLSELWLNLQELAKACQKANTINGTVITLRNKASQQTMAILRGQISGNVVYDPSGNNTSGYVGGSSLAKA